MNDLPVVDEEEISRSDGDHESALSILQHCVDHLSLHEDRVVCDVARRDGLSALAEARECEESIAIRPVDTFVGVVESEC